MSIQHKLIIQIPCHNEEGTIGLSLDALPRNIEAIDVIEYQIIDDGCTDKTVEVARAHGVHHVVKMNGHKGLARGFIAGIDHALEQGATVIVNTDADNQYEARDIPALVRSVINGEADITIGARPIDETEHFSKTKKILQKLGSRVVRLVSNTDVIDAPSGFRAISRDAAMRMHVFGVHTYTVETLIQAGQNGLVIQSIPVRTNPDLRPSRLVRSVSSYVRRSMMTIIRVFILYRPLRLFASVALLLFGAGFLLGVRYVYFYLNGDSGHVQSVILSALLMGSGAMVCLIGIVADLISTNRKLLAMVDYRIRKMESNLHSIQEQRHEK